MRAMWCEMTSAGFIAKHGPTYMGTRYFYGCAVVAFCVETITSRQETS